MTNYVDTTLSIFSPDLSNVLLYLSLQSNQQLEEMEGSHWSNKEQEKSRLLPYGHYFLFVPLCILLYCIRLISNSFLVSFCLFMLKQ